MSARQHLAISMFAIALCCSTAVAGKKASMLPPTQNDSSLDTLFDLEERPIWPEIPHNSVVRYRVSFIGIRCKIHVVRFDERPDGSVRGEAKVENRCHRDEPCEAHDFRLQRSQFAQVKAAMAKAGLWEHPISYWTTYNRETICIDGIDVTFERRDAQDFRMDQSNVWCETTRDYVVAARLLLIAVNDRPGLALLPDIGDEH
jgi:hypothetical protein